MGWGDSGEGAGRGREREGQRQRERERLPREQREVRKCERSSNRKAEGEGEEYGPERPVRGGETLGRWRLGMGKKEADRKRQDGWERGAGTGIHGEMSVGKRETEEEKQKEGGEDRIDTGREKEEKAHRDTSSRGAQPPPPHTHTHVRDGSGEDGEGPEMAREDVEIPRRDRAEDGGEGAEVTEGL